LLPSDFKITVVGLGLIGASMAMALRQLRPAKIWGIDIDPAIFAQAEQMGIIDQGFLDPAQVLPQSDLVVMAVYPELTLTFIREQMAHFKPGALITDTAGIKSRLMAEIPAMLRPDLDFIGGHPMAGRAGAGIGQARTEIFLGTNYLLTLGEKNLPANVALLESIIYGIGCKRIVRLDPDKHDRIIAYVSHLPHLLAVSLVNANMFGVEASPCIGGSFRDSTRVAEINADLWTELLLDNRENVLEQVEHLEETLDSLKESIISGDRQRIRETLVKADQTRRELFHG